MGGSVLRLARAPTGPTRPVCGARPGADPCNLLPRATTPGTLASLALPAATGLGYVDRRDDHLAIVGRCRELRLALAWPTLVGADRAGAGELKEPAVKACNLSPLPGRRQAMAALSGQVVEVDRIGHGLRRC